ncbi:YopX family protein [Clostridioides difficile]|nr:YopX family protein [Clostridioides difficile]MDW0092773.1 YopX family protein [Clostridioides difficile]
MELKFREWNKKHNKMYSYEEIVHYSKQLVKRWVCEGAYLPGGNKNFEIMIYTGLRDYCGREIYEGDIVSYNGNITPFGNDEFVGEVKFTDGCFVIENELLEKRVELFNEIAMTEIIGNIYENSEMLKGVRKVKRGFKK